MDILQVMMEQLPECLALPEDWFISICYDYILDERYNCVSIDNHTNPENSIEVFIEHENDNFRLVVKKACTDYSSRNYLLIFDNFDRQDFFEQLSDFVLDYCREHK